MNMNFQTLLLVGILVVLILIYAKVSEIYLKLTERQRLAEQKNKQSMEAFIRGIDLRKKAWDGLSEADKARFNDFHYEHAIGKMSDDEYQNMKAELLDKSNGILE